MCGKHVMNSYGILFDTVKESGAGQGGGGMGGMGGYGGGPPMGEDEQLEMKIGFMDAVFGTTKEVEVQRLSACDTCASSGIKPGTSASTCGECGGQGQTIKIIRTPLGTFQQMATCSTCGGQGAQLTFDLLGVFWASGCVVLTSAKNRRSKYHPMVLSF